MRTPMSSLLDEVAALLREDGWDVFECRGRPCLLIMVYGEHGTMLCFLETSERPRMLSVRVEYPVHIEQSRIPLVQAHAAHANVPGAGDRFDLDLDQGMLAVKSDLALTDRPVSLPPVRELLVCCLTTADRNFDSIMRLSQGRRERVGTRATDERVTIEQAVRMANRALDGEGD